MDDVCLSFSSVEEAEAGIEGVSSIFAAAGMELHKVRTTGISSDNSSILGMGWNTTTDQRSLRSTLWSNIGSLSVRRGF